MTNKITNLSKNSLFIGMLIFGLITNLLAISNIRFLLLRPIFTFFYFAVIPGLLIMMILKIGKVKFWEYLVYTIGLSVSFIMFAGLVINFILPLLNVTHKPLTFIPLLLSFNILQIILGVIAYKRSKKTSFEIKFLKLNTLNKVCFVVPLIFPLLSILGAMTLNNGGSNFPTMILLGGISIYILFLSLVINKINENVYPWSLFLISISLIFMGSLRGWYISQTDGAQEYALFKLTFVNGFWNYWQVPNSYNGMLSTTILPTILLNLININDFLILKLIYPIFYALVPVVMFVTSRKWFNKEVSFFGTLFYVFQPAFTAWTLMPPRQEIAFFFFSMMFLVIFSKFTSQKINNFLFLIFGVTMIVSHYSTSYIAAIMFVLILILFLIYKKWKSKQADNTKLETNNWGVHLSGMMVFLFLFIEFLWYFKITSVGSGVVEFTNKSFSNINNILNQNEYSQDNSPFKYINVLNVFRVPQFDPTKSLNDYVQNMNITEADSRLNQVKLQKFPTFITRTSELPQKGNIKLYSIFDGAKNFLILLGSLFIMLGIYYYVFLTKPHKKILIFASLASLGTLLILVVLPLASVDYTPVRIYQQVLIILSTFTSYGMFRIFYSHSRLRYSCFGLFILTYLILFTHIQYYFIGGREIQLRFANVGKDYDLHYVTTNEIRSADWLYINKKESGTVAADYYANYKLFQSEYYDFANFKIDILPVTINNNDYVFSSRSNTLLGVTFKFYEGGLLFYNFPKEFLNTNKNLVYTNGGSEIFK